MVRTIVKDILLSGTEIRAGNKVGYFCRERSSGYTGSQPCRLRGNGSKYDRNQKESDHCKYRAG